MKIWLLRKGVFPMTKPTARDAELITAVLNRDSDALDILFKTYLPMVYNTYAQYYIRLFEHEDWLQEARIVCFETCQCYDCHCGKSFGGFYKLRFQHHIDNLLRKELAQKRRIDHQALLLARCPEIDAIGENSVTYYQSKEMLMTYLECLSPFELMSFRVLSGTLDTDQACQQFDCTLAQLERGQSRCRTKLKQYYQSHVD